MRQNKIFNKVLILLVTLAPAAFVSCDNTEIDDQETQVVRTYPMVASGQTILYDDDGAVISSLSVGDIFYGQDANYLKGSTMSFVNNGDGTITDNNTDLMWEEIPVPDGLTYEEAITYCEDLVLAGYDDWRMPSLKELFSISDFGKGWPYLDTTFFKLASGFVDKSEQFWSSNRYVGVTTEGQDNAAFGVNHVTGHIKAYPAKSMDSNSEGGMEGDSTLIDTPPPGGEGTGDNTGEGTGEGNPPPGGGSSFNPLTKHVRAVRGDAYGVNEYIDNGDGTITDNATGLMWTQADNKEGLDWEDALSYAENSEFAGHSDWRLPNVKELQGIVDYAYSSNATDPAKVGPAIDPIFECSSITNEAGNSDYPYFWTGTSANFTSDQPYYYAWYVAFGQAVDGGGNDTHGAGAVRFDTKHEDGPLGEGGERYYNYVRLVRDVD